MQPVSPFCMVTTYRALCGGLFHVRAILKELGGYTRPLTSIAHSARDLLLPKV